MKQIRFTFNSIEYRVTRQTKNKIWFRQIGTNYSVSITKEHFEKAILNKIYKIL